MSNRLIGLLLLCYSICSYGQYNISRLMDCGRSALEYHDYISAIRYFNSVIEFRPQIHEAYYYRGESKFHLGDYSGAESDLSEVLSLNPFYYDAYDLRGLSRISLHKYSEASNDYQIATTYKTDDLSIWYNLVVCLLKSNQYERADSVSNHIISHWPENPYGYVLKGRSLYFLTDMEKCEQSILTALSKDKYNLEALNICARLYLEEKRWKESADLYSRILYIQPNNREASRCIEICNLSSESSLPPLHLTDISSLSEVMTEGFSLYIPLQSEREEIDAKNMYEILPPHNLTEYKYEAFSSPIHFRRGYEALLLKDYPKAISEFNQCINQSSEISESYYNRAYAYARINDYSKAITDLSTAISLNKNYAEAYYNRGLLQMRLNNISASRQDFSKAGELGINFAYEIIKKL